MSRRRSGAELGMALAEWTLAAMLGVILLAAALTWLQGSLQMALVQRVPLQMAGDAAWLFRRLELAALQAGRGGAHPLGNDDARLAPWRMTDGSGPGTPASDQLLLRRRLEAGTLDCEGRRLAVGTDMVERYFLRADSSASGLVLACDAGFCDAAGCHDLGDAGAALLSEVDSFQVLYAAITEAALAPGYVDATSWLAQPAPPRLLALRVGLLLRSRESVARPRRWSLPADWLGHDLRSASDRQAHSAWQQTLAVPHG